MNRRQILAGSAILPFAARSLMLHAAESADKPPARPSASGRPNYDRYRLTLNRVLHGSNPSYTSDFLLEDLRGTPGRRFTNFSGDLSGRWIGALAASSSSFDEDFPELDDFVKRALPLQHTEGYFGKSFDANHPGDDDLALLWGNGRLLVGLMEYYSLRRDASSLSAARRLGDFLVAVGPAFNSQKMADDFGAGHFATSYICWTQQTEGLALLYAATRDVKYRDLCADISVRTVRRPGDHVHGYLCSVRGTMALYEATKDRVYLDRSIAAWKDIISSGDILITGAVPEAWSPKKKRTEGCAECDWLRLNLALYRATGDPVYLATADSFVFNEFAMNQFASGDFGHGELDDGGTPATVAVRAWWCCTLHGLRAFPDLNNHVFRQSGNEVSYDLALDGRLKTPAVALVAESHLATESKVRIHIQRAKAGHSFTARKPEWSETVTLSRNGTPVNGLRVDQLRAGEIIEANYAMKFRTQSADAVQSRPNRSAIYFGPWLLGASSHQQPEYFNELYDDNEIVAGSLKSSASHDSSACTVPIAATTCTCIPAEFPEQAMTVELRPVAEQTGYDPARWMTAFKMRVGVIDRPNHSATRK